MPQVSQTIPVAPVLWRVRDAAKYVGMSVESFVTGVDAGDIPIPILHVNGYRYVRSADLNAFISGSTSHA